MDTDIKKAFVQQGSLLYAEMIKLTQSDVIRRYLAFRIMVNSMSFEDLVQNRQFQRVRKVRDVLLAHKQEAEFFEGYRAVDEITDRTITPLVSFMNSETATVEPTVVVPELRPGNAQKSFQSILPKIFDRYEEDNLSGHRVINNFLCYTGSSVQEISGGELAGVFYRYNSSMALFDLAQYIYNNTHAIPDLIWTSRHAKLDILLHAQNLADCTTKDTRNPHSIDGLLEVMNGERIGDPAAINTLVADNAYTTMYVNIRAVRNKLIGHMDKSAAFANLLTALDRVSVGDVYDFVNMVDKAVFDASQSHIAISTRY